MTQAQFTHLMLKARTLADLGDETDYWNGYQRGLRRAFHGDQFGTDEEHALWLALAEAPETDRKEKGRGYRDGLKA